MRSRCWNEDEMKSYWILIKMEDLFALKEYNILINTSVRNAHAQAGQSTSLLV